MLILTIALLLPTVYATGQSVSFGFYEITKIEAVDMDKMQSTDPKIEDGHLFLYSAYPTKPGVKAFWRVQCKTTPLVVLDDLKKAYPKDKSIEMEFTMQGARHWAKVTKELTGKKIAMVINNRVYAMPQIVSAIKIGRAVIPDLRSEREAAELSKLLDK